jgi:serine/threonine protein kinase/tetratricopeptide (TPR) repeat protein
MSAERHHSRIGSQIGGYRIDALLGRGGMGEVYRAHDLKLKRDVAIKLLPQDTAADPERHARFEREAQAIAALNHPNIVTIHSVEDADGVLFLTMELVEGHPLDAEIVADGLPLARILALAVPLADAVSAAHQKGITHRDLKPANVMVTPDGRVKVLDFGVAKLVEASDVAPDVTALPTVLTGEGRIVGTAAYMSPEQAEGKPVDHRSDIFSLGVLLYELATGERPFTGDTQLSLLSSILRDTPRAVTDLRPTLPRDLARIIKRCLAKDPEYRYQSAKDLRNELRELRDESESHEPDEVKGDQIAAAPPVKIRTWRKANLIAIGLVALAAASVAGAWLWFTPTSADGPIDSLAILPFVNAGADPDADYLSDGITENLINSLSQLPQLRVVPRSTVFRYKGRDLDFKKIAAELSVRAVLTGRVVQRGDTLNIQTDLVDVTEDAQLWGRQYSRAFADLIPVQEEIVTAVSSRLRLQPNADEQKRLTKRYTENPAAHQLYLKGQFSWARRTAERLQRAAEYFQQAIKQDPGYALAWAGLADAHAIYGFYGAGSPREAVPTAKEAAFRALDIDDTLAEAHSAMGFVKFTFDWDWSAAAYEFKRAIALNPRDGLVLQRYAMYLQLMGRPEDALEQGKRALELEPLSSNHNAQMGRLLYQARRYDQAARQLQESLELDPNYVQTYLYLGWVYEQLGKYEEAIAALQKAFDLSGGESETSGALGHAYAVSGKRREAEAFLVTLKERSKQHYIAPFDVALVYAGLGSKSSTLEWLEKAYDDRSTWLTWIKVDPRFDIVRDDPRYRDLLRRMNLSE